jgi:hypothetical protein
MPAAAIGVMWTSCCAIGEAWLMIMIPAETLMKSINHNSQNCGVRIAARTVKSMPLAAWTAMPVGCQSGGRQPGGGLR